MVGKIRNVPRFTSRESRSKARHECAALVAIFAISDAREAPPALLAPLKPHPALKARHRASAAPTDPSSETRNHEASLCLAQRGFSFPAIAVGAPATGECPGSSRSGYPCPVDLVGRASCKVMGTFRSLTNTQHVATYQFYLNHMLYDGQPEGKSPSSSGQHEFMPVKAI